MLARKINVRIVNAPLQDTKLNTPSEYSVYVLPAPRRKQAIITCESPPDATVSLRIDDAPHQIAVDGNTFTVTFDDTFPWSPSEPHLCHATLEVANGDGITQTITVPIGLRQFTVGENRFRINQRPIPIRGASIRGGSSPDAVTLDHLSQLGHNAVRIPFTDLNAETLAAADLSGMLVFATLTSNAPLSETVSEDAAQFIHDHFNHPSLVAWHLRFRTDSIDSTDRIQTIKRHIASVRAIDSTRLILGDVIDHDGFPLLSLVVNPNQTKDESTQLARIAVSPPMSSEFLQAAHGFGDSDRLVTADIVCPMVPGGIEVQSELVDEAVDDIVRALRSNIRIAGYWVEERHQHSGAAPAVIAGSVHQPVRPVAALEHHNLLPGEETNASVSFANDSAMTGRVELSLQVVGPTGQVLWKKKRELPIPKGRKEIWQGAVGASSKPGRHRFVVRVMKDRRVLAQDDVPFHVLAKFDWSASRVHIVGHGPDSGVRSLSKIVEEIEAPVYVLPPIANTIWAYPAETICHILAFVQGGATGIVLAPPSDWDDLTQCFDEIPVVRSILPTFSCGAIAYHTARHPILEGVRTADVMGSSYQNLRRNVLLAGQTDESLTTGIMGAFEGDGGGGQSVDENEINDVIVQNFGEGKLVFANYDPLKHANHDPAAESLLRNLVDYGASRAAVVTKPPPFQKAIDYWRKRAAPLLRWRILGPLRAGVKAPPLPVSIDDFGMTHTGAYGHVVWGDWWAANDLVQGDGCVVDLAEASQRDTARELGSHGLMGFAAHTFRTPVRETKTITLESRAPARLWFNGRLIGSTAEEEAGILMIDVTTRDGLNIVVVESTADQKQWEFRFDMEGAK